MYRRLESLSAEKNVQTSTEISVLCSFLVSCTVVCRKFYTGYVMAILVYDFLSTLYGDPTPKPVLLRARGLTLFGSFTLRCGWFALPQKPPKTERNASKQMNSPLLTATKQLLWTVMHDSMPALLWAWTILLPFPWRHKRKWEDLLKIYWKREDLDPQSIQDNPISTNSLNEILNFAATRGRASVFRNFTINNSQTRRLVCSKQAFKDFRSMV